MRICLSCPTPLPTDHPLRRYCNACRIVRKRKNAWMYRSKWNSSFKAKLAKMRYEEKHKERIAARRSVRWRASYKPSPTTCSTELCDNQFFRPGGSHRKFCDDCAVIFFGKKYLKSRSNPHVWVKAA